LQDGGEKEFITKHPLKGNGMDVDRKKALFHTWEGTSLSRFCVGGFSKKPLFVG